jgi:hypothetical protein
LSHAEDRKNVGTLNRITKPLDKDWKLYRKSIEWRCRWLELKTNQIKAELSQYDESLRSLQSAKIWKWEGEVGEGTSARTVPVKILRNHPVVHRKHRRRAEDAEDLDLGRHPVFSRYGTESSFSVRVCQVSSGHRGLAVLTSLSNFYVQHASCVPSRQTVNEIYGEFGSCKVHFNLSGCAVRLVRYVICY